MIKLSNYREIDKGEINKKNDLFFSYKSHRWRKILYCYVGKPHGNGEGPHLRRKQQK